MILKNSDLIFNSLDNGIVLINKDLEVFYWNRWLERRTNISHEEIKGKSLLEFFPTLETKRLKRKINTSLKLNIATYYNTAVNKYLLEINLNKITNKVFDNMQQSVTITPYDLEEGMVLLYIYDNTLLYESSHHLERKNAELEESKNEIDLLLNASMEAMFLFENNICKHVNQKAIDLFEYDNEEELKNVNFFNLIDKQYRDFYLEDQEDPYEIKMKTKFDLIFHALIQIKNMKFNNKDFKVITVLNITELKEKDKILSEQSKMAALGEMLANIAHQWRQPLNAISTITSGIQFQKELDLLTDDKLHRGIDDVLNITEHLSQTISDFRNFMKQDKEKSEFIIDETITKTLSMLEGISKEKNIEIIHTSNNENLKVVNFPNELVQALINIINNAQDALSKQEKDKYIFITTSNDKENAYIEIKDSAGGIDEKVMDKVFEPYFTTKHQEQGTGLGLYMTHQLIEMSMKGSINLKNSSYKYDDKELFGAHFTIKLPLTH